MSVKLSKKLLEMLNNEIVNKEGNIVGDDSVDLNINRQYVKVSDPHKNKLNPVPNTDDHADATQHYSRYMSSKGIGICEEFAQTGADGASTTPNGDVIIPIDQLPNVYEGGGFEKLSQLLQQVDSIVKDNKDAKNSVLQYFDKYYS